MYADGMDETTDTAVARADIHIDATPDTVWTTLTTPDGLGEWMGAGAELDAEPDGRLDLPDPAGGRPRRGRITEVDVDRRLAFEWWPVDAPHEHTSVTIDLRPHGRGTFVTVTETPPRLRAVGATTAAHAAWAWRTALVAHECARRLRVVGAR